MSFILLTQDFPPSSYEVRVVCEKKLGPLELLFHAKTPLPGMGYLYIRLEGEAGEVRCKGLGNDFCPL